MNEGEEIGRVDPKTFYVKGRDKNQLLEGLMRDSQGPGTNVYEQQRMGIFVRCTEDIQAVIQKSITSNERLANTILALNIILGIFTVVGTVLTIYQMVR